MVVPHFEKFEQSKNAYRPRPSHKTDFTEGLLREEILSRGSIPKNDESSMQFSESTSRADKSKTSRVVLFLISYVSIGIILSHILLFLLWRKYQSTEEHLLNTENLQYQQIIEKINNLDICNHECMKEFVDTLPHLEDNNGKVPEVNNDFKFPRYASLQCDDIPLDLRFDCSQDMIDSSPESCEARGCCWKIAKPDDVPERFMINKSKTYKPIKKYLDLKNASFNLNIPYCFYPKNYFIYNFSEIILTKNGIEGTLQKAFKSGLPNDVSVLGLEIIYETCSRIRIKIFDKNSKRWETPIPKVPSSFPGCSQSRLYTVELQEHDGTIVIRRSDSGIPIFDTRNAAPLIFADQFLQLSTLLSSPYLYGLGQHLDGLLLDTYWKRRVLWNLDQAPTQHDNLYGSHPFYMNLEQSGAAHGLFLLNSNAMDIRMQPTPALTFRVIGGILDFYVFLGPTPDLVISQYTDVIGKPFLPPYWSLGYHQCRFGYNTIDQTRKVWQRTRDAGIPFDVQWNDIDYMNDNKDFTYDEERFSGLPQFVEELHKSGMHYIIMTDPGISGGEKPGTYLPYDLGIKSDIFVKNSSGDLFIGKVWNPSSTVFPDFTKPNAIIYWSFLIQKFHREISFDGLWIDMNEPSNFWSGQEDGCPDSTLENPPYLPPVEGGKLFYKTLCMTAKQFLGLHYDVHNLYGISEVITTYGALRMIKEISSPFIISRSTFPGIGAYGGHWTGDIHSDWFNLWKSIGDVLTMGILGIPTVGADICGFNGNTTAPLCNRWMQLGAFYPFSRNHNTDDGIDQDPVAMGDLVVRSSRKALIQRYTMLPYLYSLFFRAHINGIPVAKPLFFKYPWDSETYDIDSQFLWGEAIMIIPVLQEDETSVLAYFPIGIWYDWYTGKIVSRKGQEYLMLPAPLDTIPIVVSGGTIIPCQIPGNTTTDSRKNPFFLIVALDQLQQANGELFWSHQETRDPFENKKYIQWKFRSIAQQLTIQSTTFGNSSEEFILDEIRFLGVASKVLHVSVNGEKAQFTFSAVDQTLKVINMKMNFLNSISVNWGS